MALAKLYQGGVTLVSKGANTVGEVANLVVKALSELL
jgi:hypothetical protein